MELARSKTARCNFCGAQTTVPQTMHIIPCPLCHATIRVQSNDPLSHATSKFKDLVHTASSNINHVMTSTVNSYSGFGYPPHFRPLPSVSTHGRKRAVLCGVSYHGQKYELDGSVNDVKCMRYFLIQKLGFPTDSVIMLSEEGSNPDLIPTKSNMRKALQWLVHGCQPGDSLVFHYSGHASQQLDYDGDELDGHDEVLWPVDHQTVGTIVDDEINDTIVRLLPRGAKLHAIVDACHSGTILDLPFVCRMNRDGHYMWEDQYPRHSTIYKGTNGGFAVSFSACDDHQLAIDTTALSKDNTATGVMTYSFIQAVQNDPGLTYGCLLNVMRQTIRDFRTRGLLKTVFRQRSPQEPQLSSSEKFDIYTKQFVL